jgi:hypothetical protein
MDNIHQFDSLEELIKNAKETISANAADNRASEKDLDDCQVIEFKKPQNAYDSRTYFKSIF